MRIRYGMGLAAAIMLGGGCLQALNYEEASLDPSCCAGGAGGTAVTTSSFSSGGGDAGDPNACTDGDGDCIESTPRRCASGVWVAQNPCTDPNPVCKSGSCVACTDGAKGCMGNIPRSCVGGAWMLQTPCTNPYPACYMGACVASSCSEPAPGSSNDCGASKSADCCASTLVSSGTFNRDNNPMFPGSVAEFRLDAHEITVGRFRTFINTGTGKGTQSDPPMLGDGAHPKLQGSGWNTAWKPDLAIDSTALRAALKCDTLWTWTDVAGSHENAPISCLTWYEAFAFCAWDGGFLPTEVQWNYAATGGNEQRFYPWGAMLDDTKASYTCKGDGSPACSLMDLVPVGSKSPGGDGKWGQSDLAGNVAEWVLDWYASPYAMQQCNDCTLQVPQSKRSFRGGGYNAGPGLIQTNFRQSGDPSSRSDAVGARCARIP